MSRAGERRPVVLHFTGYDEDVGGVLNYIRAASLHNGARNILVVGRSFRQTRGPCLPLLRVQSMNAESLYHPRTTGMCFLLALRFHFLMQSHPRLIFHGHSRAGLLIAQWLNFWGHTRSVATVHANGRHRWFYRWMALLLGRRLTFLCPSMKRYYGMPDGSWQNCFPGAPLSPVNTDRGMKPLLQETLSEAAVGEALCLDPSPMQQCLRLGGLGALVGWKRWGLVLEALAKLPPELRAWACFEHVGATLDDPASRACADALREKTIALGLEDCVTWSGPLGDTDAFFEGLDALLVCSDHEPWGLAMLEALFAGVPVIASASGGPSDVIRDGQNGFLFADGDPAALAALLAEILTEQRALPVVRATDLERFSAPAFGEKWRRFYAGR